jgi:hypothetical protein
MEIFLGLEEGMLSQERVLLMLSISHHDYQMDYKFSATMHNAKKFCIQNTFVNTPSPEIWGY